MKKLILAVTVLGLTAMAIPSVKAGVSFSFSLGVPGGFVVVNQAAYCPPPAVYCPPAAPVCAPVVYAPPVIISRPRPVCVTSANFVAIHRDGRYDRHHDERRDYGRDHHNYR